MRTVLNKSYRENKTHILYSVTLSQKSHRLWDKVEKYGGASMLLLSFWRRVACWISKATRAQAHSNARVPTLRTHAPPRTHIYVRFTAFFLWQQWFRERASLLHHTRWFRYDRDKLWLVYTQSVPVTFEPPCTYIACVVHNRDGMYLPRGWPVNFIFKCARCVWNKGYCRAWLID